MSKSSLTRYQIWLAKSKDDLRYAEGNLEMEFYSQVCFLAQQSAEKALKAYLISKGIPSQNIRIHALPRLIKECLHFDSSFGSIRHKCQILDRYYIPTRYPPDAGPLGEFSQQEAEEALELAKEVLAFIEEKLP